MAGKEDPIFLTQDEFNVQAEKRIHFLRRYQYNPWDVAMDKHFGIERDWKIPVPLPLDLQNSELITVIVRAVWVNIILMKKKGSFRITPCFTFQEEKDSYKYEIYGEEEPDIPFAFKIRYGKKYQTNSNENFVQVSYNLYTEAYRFLNSQNDQNRFYAFSLVWEEEQIHVNGSVLSSKF
jgi:hypothetical protein